MELTSAMDKANMNLKGAGEQNMAFAGKIQMLEVDITKIRQVRKVPKFISSKAKLFQVNHELLPYLNSFVRKKLEIKKKLSPLLLISVSKVNITLVDWFFFCIPTKMLMEGICS